MALHGPLQHPRVERQRQQVCGPWLTALSFLLALFLVLPTAHAEAKHADDAQRTPDRFSVAGWVGVEGDLGLGDLGGAVEGTLGAVRFPLAIFARAGALAYGDLFSEWQGFAWYAEPGLALTSESGRWRLSARGTIGVARFQEQRCPLLGSCTETAAGIAATGTLALQLLAQPQPHGVYAGGSLGVRAISGEFRPLIGLHVGLAL